MKYHSENVKDIMESARQRFLDYYKTAKSKSTYKSYKRGLALFEEYYGKSSDEALKERKEDVTSEDFERSQRFVREIEKFHSWLRDEGYSINTARTYCLGIQQLFRYYGVPITLPPQSKVSKTVISRKTYIPKIEQLQKMFKVASLRGKVILSLGLDLGWRIGDFAELRKEDIPDLEQKTPISFEKITQKEQVMSKTFISSESKRLLKTYIPTLPKDNPYLFPSNGKTHLKHEAINNVLKKLLEKAKVKIPKRKRFTFHSLRKRFLSTAYTLGIDNEIAKLLVGKSIDKAMETYLGEANLEKAFIQIREESLSLTERKAKSEIEMKDQEISDLKSEIAELKTIIKMLAVINSESITKTLEQKMKEKGLKEMIDTEGIPDMSAYDKLRYWAKMKTEEQKVEYDKMLKETNSFNNKR